MPSHGYLSPVRDEEYSGNVDAAPVRTPLGNIARGLDDASAWRPWADPEVVDTTPSTMIEVEQRAQSGAAEGTVVVAEHQSAGRGRQGRHWESVRYAGLWMSLLLRPAVSPTRLGWLPLIVGLGVARGLRGAGAAEAVLKWPNDVLLPLGKVAGILAERLPDGAVVVGIGINVDHGRDELPEGATSLRLSGVPARRDDVLVWVLDEVASAYRAWNEGGDLREDYRRWCVTLGSQVTAQAQEGPLSGLAADVDDLGRLLVVVPGGERIALSAGDVAIVRPPM